MWILHIIITSFVHKYSWTAIAWTMKGLRFEFELTKTWVVLLTVNVEKKSNLAQVGKNSSCPGSTVLLYYI